MTDTVTIATWEQATHGARDTNPFDHVESQLVGHHLRVGLYDVVRSYATHVKESLPGHIDFVDNTFVTRRGADLDRCREDVVAAIREADARHREHVATWLS